MKHRKQDILGTLTGFVNQRPGLEFGNYGDVRLYRQEYRNIQRDKADYIALLNAVLSADLSAQDILTATSAFSGRLSIKELGDRKVEIDYCTGQYFPTEYRKAACAVLASALWDMWRKTNKTGDDIRAKAKAELGHSIAKRWFN